MADKKNVDVRRLCVLAALSALAYVCVLLFRVPIGGFLTYEPKDCLLAVGGLLYGPFAAVLMSMVVSLVESFTISATGWIGLIMNVLASVLFVCPPAVIYKRTRTLRGALVGLGLGILLMTGGMLIWNWLITPLYTGMPRGDVAKLLLPLILPFNLLKASVNATLTVLLYKSLVTALRRAHLFPHEELPASSRISGRAIWPVALLLLVTLVLIVLVWQDVF